MIEAGTLARGLLEEMRTAAPPAGAGELRVTVVVADNPPMSDDGLTVIDVTAGGITVYVSVRRVPPIEAVTVTAVLAATGVVPNEKTAVVCPAGTTIEAGGFNTGLLLDNKTVAPPVGAGAASTTRLFATCPPPYPPEAAREKVNELTAFGVKMRRSVRVEPWSEAAMVTVVLALTSFVETEKVMDLEPAGIVTDGGTVTEAELLDRETANPPVGAGVVMTTVFPETGVPPVTEVAAKASEYI